MQKDKKTKIIIGSLCGVLIICLIIILLVKAFAKPQYEIKFDTDGGSQISSLKVQKGDVISKPQDPTKEGYVFTGWYLNNQEYDFKDKVTTTLILKAKWQEEKFHLNTDKITLKIGDKVTLEASAKELTWQSSDEKIVKVNQKGQVTALKVGKATITVTNKKGEKVECAVTVQEKDDNEIVLSKITIKGNKEIEVGKTTKLTITYTPKDATNQKVIWSSNNIQIATVDQKGNVKGLKAGKVTIMATSENGLKATYEVTIKAKAQSTTPNPGTTTTTNPGTGTQPSGGSGGSGGSGSDSGGSGSVTTPNSGQSTGTTEQPKVEATKITITGSTKVNVNEGIDLKVNFEPTNTTDKTVTWSSSSTSIATVDQNGHVIGKAEGTVTITAKTKNGKEATYQIEVKSIYVIYLTANYLMNNLSDYSFKVERDGKVFTDYESFDIVGNAYYPSNGVVGKDDVTDLGSERTTTLKLKNGQTRQATIVIN